MMIEEDLMRLTGQSAAQMAGSRPEAFAADTIVLLEDSRSEHTLYSSIIKDTFRKHQLKIQVPDERSANHADRLENTLLQAQRNKETKNSRLGCFTTGNNTASALLVATRHPTLIDALVLCGGRPDEAAKFLSQIKIPVLLIAPGRDPACVRSQRRALEKLGGHAALNIIPHATQFFQEPGAMEEAAQLAALWFLQNF